ncbi:unnamed protein product [Durusdinium trenchii]|uniref:ERV/ALR sulfhydryl oxidase domain-containing protein n=1 Tax=Durusdinium trenchii TaxID=1381693 RepID=A0ABP0IQB9_9DINO
MAVGLARLMLTISLALSARAGEDPNCLIQVQHEQKSSSPHEYYNKMTPAALEIFRELLNPGMAGADPSYPCGGPIADQKMYFAGPGRCSIASANMIYMMPNGTLTRKSKGEQILMSCDDVMCPVPVIADCYMSPEICAEDEWCWIRQHEKWGAWAMGPLMNGTFGHTPDTEYCDQFMKSYARALARAQQANNIRREEELNKSRDILCPSSSQVFGDNAWRPIRGQCVPYRKEQQSCFQQQDLAPTFTGNMMPRYKYDDQGFPMERPLACAPNLACTGPKFNVLPSTCVQKRPQDICYYGPWWDSSDCPRKKMKDQSQGPGLTYNVTVDALISAAMLFPGEIAWMGTCTYWDRTKALGQAALRVRKQVYKIAATLWPMHVLKQPIPTFEELSKLLPDPFEYLISQGYTPEQASIQCVKESNKQRSEVAILLGKAGVLSAQPNKVWSVVHFFTFNLDEKNGESKGLASQALASLLAQNFWCNDCRSFFEVGVIEQFGLPKMGKWEIAQWWHHAHNVASEHVATTRAGHPWIHQLDSLKEYQNPFYMSWEDAYQMWHVPTSDTTDD